jgi:PAS domain S-box-containing protein
VKSGRNPKSTPEPSSAAQDDAVKLQAQLLNCVRESVVATDLDGRILYWSHGAEVMYGYSASEVVGKPYRQFAGAVEAPDSKAFREEIISKGSWRGEHVQRRKDGTTFWSSTSISVVTDEQGHPTGFVGIDADITKRKLMEQALRENEGRLRLFIEHAPAALAMFDRDMRYIAVSRRWRTDYNLGEVDLIGRSHYEVFPEIGDTLKAIHRRAMAGEVLKGDEDRFDRADGSVQWLKWETRPWHDQSGVIGGIVIFSEDITQRKEVEEALLTSEAQLSNALRIARAGHWEYDVASDTFTFNDNFYRIFRTTAEEMGGYTMRSTEYARRFCHPDDLAVVAREIKKSNETPDPDYSRQIEHRILFADGEPGWIAVQFFVVKDAQGHTVKTFGVNQDITERKRVEEALREAHEILKAVLDAIPVRVFWKDTNLVYLGCNEPFARDAGFEKIGDILGKDDYAMGWKGQAELYRRDDRDVIQSGKAKLLFEEPQTTPSGETIQLLTSKVPLRNADGAIVGVLGAYFDVTERKQAEDALRETQALLNDVGRIAKIGGWKMDLITRKATWTLGTHEIVEIEPGQPIPGPDEHVDYYLPPYRPMIVEAMRALIEDDKPLEFEAELRSAKGTIKWCRAIGRAIRTDGKAVAVYGTFQDITELKKAEQALADELVRRRLLVEQSRDGIVMLDEDGAVVEANRKYAEMLGYTPEEVLNLHVWDWDAKVAREQLLEMLRTVDAAGDHFETQHRRKDGSVFPVEISTNGAEIGGRKLVFCVCRDVTERKEAETKMKKQLSELRQWYSVTLDREERMLELKREVDQLLSRLGEKARYGIG